MSPKNSFLLAVFCLLTATATAQNNIIDEVIWIIGDEAILKSEVEHYRIRAQFEGTPIQGNPNCVIPEQLAIQKLFLHQAQLDSIEISESTVNNQVEMRLNYFINQVGSQERMEEIYEKSINVIREEQRQVVREQLIIQQMKNKLVGDIKSTPAEVRRFFNSLSEDEIPVVPAQVELQIISFQPPVPIEEIDYVKDRLRQFSERVHNGTAEFSVLARLYSEDTETARRGGELGFMGRGQLVPEFANVAFNLNDPKRVSRVFETEYGFHIVQLIEKRGDRINARHILMKPKVSQEDRIKGINRLDSIAGQIRNGRMTFEQGVVMFSQDKNTAMNAGLMMNPKTGTSRFQYQDLPQEIARIAYDMNVGEISRAFSMIDPSTNKEIIALVRVKSKIDTHKANLRDDYQLLRDMYEEQKKMEFLNNWIARKQRETYIRIDPAWQNCEFEYPGWIK